MREAAASGRRDHEHFGPQKVPKQPIIRFVHLPSVHAIREHQPMLLQLAAQICPVVHLAGAAAFFAAIAVSVTSASDRQVKPASRAIFMSSSSALHSPCAMQSSTRRESGNNNGVNFHSQNA